MFSSRINIRGCRIHCNRIACRLERVSVTCPYLLINRRVDLDGIVRGLEPRNGDSVLYEQIGTCPSQPEGSQQLIRVLVLDWRSVGSWQIEAPQDLARPLQPELHIGLRISYAVGLAGPQYAVHEDVDAG